MTTRPGCGTWRAASKSVFSRDIPGGSGRPRFRRTRGASSPPARMARRSSGLVASDERSAPFTGHAGPVYWATFSPDGRHVATAGYDKRILCGALTRCGQSTTALCYRPTIAASRRTTWRWSAMRAPVRCVRFSADGSTLVSGSHDNTVKLWDLAQGVCTQTLRGHAGWVRSCSFAPDGRSILSAGYDHQAKIWDPARYEEIRTLRGHDDALLGAAFSPDGGRVVTASRDRTAKIWDVSLGEQTTTLSEGHSFLVSTVAFSPDGRRVHWRRR